MLRKRMNILIATEMKIVKSFPEIIYYFIRASFSILDAT